MATKFWKEEPPWLKYAKHLKPGGSVRVGDAMKISFNGFGYFMWDFRDKVPEAYQPTLTLEERLAQVKAMRDAETTLVQSASVPDNCMLHTRDWPVDARIWFYESNLNDSDLNALGFCWQADMQRVVMPFELLRGGHAWVARDPWWSRKSQRPKYLRPPQTPGAAIIGSGGKVVLTEDYLSGLRINSVTGLTAIPLMGTSLQRPDALKIAKNFQDVLLWLDPDGAGGMGQIAVRKVLSSFDLNIKGFDRYGPTDKVDPKKLDASSILEITGGFIYGD